MIKKLLRVIVVFVAALTCCSVRAEMLCVPPLQPDCIMPQWGQISPDSDALISDRQTGQQANNPATSVLAIDSNRPSGGAHIQLAQMRKPMDVPHAPKLLINDARKFDRETQALVRAIERATFTRAGKLKTGEEQIERAVQALREASKDQQLNLYIKTPRKLADRENEILMAKVHAVNEVIKEASSGSYPDKKTVPTS